MAGLWQRNVFEGGARYKVMLIFLITTSCLFGILGKDIFNQFSLSLAYNDPMLEPYKERENFPNIDILVLRQILYRLPYGFVASPDSVSVLSR